MGENVFVKASLVTKFYGEEQVLKDVSFDFREPGIYLVEGGSGTGKTTLLRIIAGLETNDGGTIETSGKIGFVFQEPRLFENVTLFENVRLVSGRRSKKKSDPALLKLFEAVGLGDSAMKTAGESSGGMCQRTSVLRALYCDPGILLCDEPFSALDDANAKLVAGLLESFAGKGICIVATHGGDLPFASVKGKISL